MIEGFNIKLTLGGKTVLGRTQEDLNISAVTKTSITKDDMGVQQERKVRNDVTLKVSALMALNGEGSVDKMDRNDVIALALATGDAAIIEVKYLVPGGDTYGGNGLISGYSETSNAEQDADASLSLDIKIVGGFSKINA